MVLPHPCGWRQEQAAYRRRRWRKWLTLAAELSALALLIGAVATLAWRLR